MDTMQQQKAALRRELTAAEQTMMPEEKCLSDSAILHHMLNTQEYRRTHTVFAFLGRGDKIDTRPLPAQISADGKWLCVPLCTSPDVMERLKVSKEKVLFSLENRTFWSCWADSNRRPHPYQKAVDAFTAYPFIPRKNLRSLVLQGIGGSSCVSAF